MDGVVDSRGVILNTTPIQTAFIEALESELGIPLKVTALTTKVEQLDTGKQVYIELLAVEETEPAGIREEG